MSFISSIKGSSNTSFFEMTIQANNHGPWSLCWNPDSPKKPEIYKFFDTSISTFKFLFLNNFSLNFFHQWFS